MSEQLPTGTAALGRGDKQVGRLAMHIEGKMWNAYYTTSDSTQGALLLGGIHLMLVERNPKRREQFLTLMRKAVADLIQQATGYRPHMWKQTA